MLNTAFRDTHFRFTFKTDQYALKLTYPFQRGSTLLKPQNEQKQHAKAATVLLHSSMSSGLQWQSLQPLLKGQSLAPDLLGYGKTNRPTNPRADHQLSFEVDHLADQLPEQAFHLVGHSYGAATAIRLARTQPEKILSLTLFEPVAFHLLDPEHPQRQAIMILSAQIDHYLDAGQPAKAAASFIDYWNGEGTFERLNEKMQALFCQGIIKVAYDFAALLNEDCSPKNLASIQCPVLLLEGAESPATTHAVMRVLQQQFPQAEHHALPCGHMGPITHSDLVNPLVSHFIATHNNQG